MALASRFKSHKLHAMTDAISGAIQVARAAFEAFADRDWATVALLTAPSMHRQTQTREIATLLAWARFEATRAQTGATGWASHGTYSPELLAEHGRTRLDRVDGQPTIAALAALEPSAFFIRWLSWGGRAVPEHLGRELRAGVIGGVAERDDLVHIVYRGGPSFGPPAPVRTMPVVRLSTGWCLPDSRDLRTWGGQAAFLMRRHSAPPAPLAP